MAVDSPTDTDVRMDMAALWAAVRRRLFRIIFVTVVLLAATYAVLLFVPKSYDAKAAILVENRSSVYTRPANDPVTANAPDPTSMISSQIELVKSRDTLLPVVRELKLADVPEFNGTAKSSFDFLTRFFHKAGKGSAEETALNNLSSHLTVIRERDSALISVIASSADPELAAKIANAVARADVNRRADLSLNDTADASQWLEQQIVAMRKRVQDAETKVANFKVNNDLYTGANSTSLPDQQLTEIASQITAAQASKDTAQSRATLIRGLLAAGQPIDGVEDVRNSVTIQQLMNQKAQLTSQRAQLLATLLPSHPSVRAITAQINSTNQQIAVEGARVADALDAEAKIEDNIITSLRANLAAIKSQAADATRQGVTLDSLTREAKADRDLLESYMSRYRDAAARTDVNSSLPDVRVVTLAAAPTTPAAPKTALILGAVGFVSLAAQIGAILFGELLSGRALIDRRDYPDYRREDDDEDTEAAPQTVAASSRSRSADDVIPALRGTLEPVAAKPTDPAAEVPEAVEQAEPDAAEGGSLRNWFSRRARPAGAVATADEPAMAADRQEPQVMESAGKPAAEAPVESAATPAALVAPVEPSDTPNPAHAANIANLSADLVLGRTRVVMLASVIAAADGEALAERLVADAMQRGLSVARVDAGSHRVSTEPGIADLSFEEASFGDVVQRVGDGSLAEVPWGHRTMLDHQSSRPSTLVEALAEIYEVVIVLTGAIGDKSTLPAFAGLTYRVVVVAPADADPADADSARARAQALGFPSVDVVDVPSRRAVA